MLKERFSINCTTPNNVKYLEPVMVEHQFTRWQQNRNVACWYISYQHMAGPAMFPFALVAPPYGLLGRYQ